MAKEKDDQVYITKLKSAVDKIFESTKTQRANMDRYLKEYGGQWWDEKELKSKQDSKVFVNYMFSTVMSVAPLLTDNRPTWTIRAQKPFMQKYVEIFSLCLKYLWEKLDMDAKVFKAVVDALVMKNGIFKVTFDPDFGTFGECRIDVVDPRCFFEAPGYDDNWECDFQGTRERKPISWIRRNFAENGKDVKGDEDDEKTAKTGWEDRAGFELQSNFATLYEVWMRDDETETYVIEGPDGKPEKDEKGKDKKGEREKFPFGKIVVFTRDVLLDERPSPYKHNRPPYVKLYDYFNPHDPIGMGEGDQIENLNRSINRAMQLMDKFMTLYNDPNWLVDENAGLDVEQVKRDLPGGGNMWSYNASINPNPIVRVEMGNLTSDLYNYVSLLPKILEEVSGVTDITKGMRSEGEKTAAEVSTLIESSYTRTRQRVRNLEHFIKRTAYLLVDIMQQYYTNIRDISLKTDQNIDYYKASSSKPYVDQMMQPQPQQPGQPPKNPQVEQQEQQDWEQYQKFIETFGEKDSVYADFDIEIETNSTLPMDRQSLANLFLRLAAMKVVDPQAVIEQLNIPKGEEIIKRMEQRAQAAMAAKGGGRPMPPPKPQGGPPQGLQQRPEGI